MEYTSRTSLREATNEQFNYQTNMPYHLFSGISRRMYIEVHCQDSAYVKQDTDTLYKTIKNINAIEKNSNNVV